MTDSHYDQLQLPLLPCDTNALEPYEAPIKPAPRIELQSYDYYIVAFSGGKDSLACLLHLLDEGVPKSRIELWHHDVDGRSSDLFDWPVTPAYCRSVAKALDVPIYFSWKEGGIEREMLRQNAATAPIHFETPEGVLRKVGGESNRLGTRLMFPQVAADLRVRWCSSYVKSDPGKTALTNQDRFLDKRTLFITGERAEESSARAHYCGFQPHPTDNREGKRKRRHVDQWRPIHTWPEAKVWEIIERYGVAPHPVYDAGFARCSCAVCIFSSSNQLATVNAGAPDLVNRHADYESRFGKTIHRTKTIPARLLEGTPYSAATAERLARCLSKTFNEPVLLNKGEWTLPAGAYSENAGPT